MSSPPVCTIGVVDSERSSDETMLARAGLLRLGFTAIFFRERRFRCFIALDIAGVRYVFVVTISDCR